LGKEKEREEAKDEPGLAITHKLKDTRQRLRKRVREETGGRGWRSVRRKWMVFGDASKPKGGAGVNYADYK
jgi:hypothetical protein